QIFSRLTLNPSREKLGGPCVRCGKYYVRKRRSKNKKYCSRRCGNAATAVAGREGRRREAHRTKLSKWRTNARLWIPSEGDFKQFLMSLDEDKELTLNWITRAINKGE